MIDSEFWLPLPAISPFIIHNTSSIILQPRQSTDLHLTHKTNIRNYTINSISKQQQAISFKFSGYKRSLSRFDYQLLFLVIARDRHIYLENYFISYFGRARAVACFIIDIFARQSYNVGQDWGWVMILIGFAVIAVFVIPVTIGIMSILASIEETVKNMSGKERANYLADLPRVLYQNNREIYF